MDVSEQSGHAERGAIYNMARYKQLFDHTPWNQILPRNITPSDIDVVFDNMRNQRALYCEFSVKDFLWTSKNYGQRMVYQQLITGSNYKNCAVLCNHEVPANQSIDSARDVLTFHVMARSATGGVDFFPSRSRAYDGELWQSFVHSFYGDENQWSEWWASFDVSSDAS